MWRLGFAFMIVKIFSRSFFRRFFDLKRFEIFFFTMWGFVVDYLYIHIVFWLTIVGERVDYC